MAKRRRIVVTGKQRTTIDADLMTQIVIVLGKQMWVERQRPKGRQRKASDDTQAEHGEAS